MWHFELFKMKLYGYFELWEVWLIYIYIYITLGGITQYICYTCFKLYKKYYKNLCIPYTKKHFQAHFYDCYQTSENKIFFHKILFGKWTIFQKTLMLKKKKTIEYIHIDLWNILRKFFLGKKSNEFYIYIYL